MVGGDRLRILVKRDVHEADSKWIALSALVYTYESDLQLLLSEGSTELVPVDPAAGDAHVVFAREVSTDSGPIDLVGIGSSGSITIMECKLAKNRQIKREVVGQVLDYAAALWQIEPSKFTAAFARKAGSDPFETLRQELIAADPPWDQEACRSEVARRLRDGDFRLLIAVDRIDDDLRRIIRFVNMRGSGDSHLQLVALAFPRFEEGATQVIVPETYGDEISPPSGTAPSRDWTEAAVLEDLAAQGDDVLAIVTEFRAWAESRGYRIRFDGDRKGGFLILTVGDTGSERDFVVLGGMLGVYFQRLKTVRPFDEQSNREDLVRRFGAAFRRELRLAQSETAAFFDRKLLADPAVKARFEAVVDDAMARVAAASRVSETSPS